LVLSVSPAGCHRLTLYQTIRKVLPINSGTTAMVFEIVYENDKCGPWPPYSQTETPANRWLRIRAWVDHHIPLVSQ
jgi:hypothetical protein